MKLSATTFILTCTFLFTACVPSLNPLYTQADLTTDATLVGTWLDKESGESWTFAGTDKLAYTLVHVDEDGRKGQYDARLVKLDDKLFLDIVPIKSGFVQNDTFRDRFIATHTFVHVTKKASGIQISYMEPRWLKDYLRDHPDAIRHENVAGEIVLTSAPKDTQKFVLAHLATPGAFSESTEFVRKRGGS